MLVRTIEPAATVTDVAAPPAGDTTPGALNSGFMVSLHEFAGVPVERETTRSGFEVTPRATELTGVPRQTGG
jgi:hypothetical protein